MHTRKPKSDRIREILDAALYLAEKHGYQTVTRDAIAEEAGVSGAHVSGLFGTMAQIRRRVMRAAVQQKRYRVIAQGIAVHDPACGKLDADTVKRAADSLKG